MVLGSGLTEFIKVLGIAGAGGTIGSIMTYLVKSKIQERDNADKLRTALIMEIRQISSEFSGNLFLRLKDESDDNFYAENFEMDLKNINTRIFEENINSLDLLSPKEIKSVLNYYNSVERIKTNFRTLKKMDENLKDENIRIINLSITSSINQAKHTCEMLKQNSKKDLEITGLEDHLFKISEVYMENPGDWEEIKNELYEEDPFSDWEFR